MFGGPEVSYHQTYWARDWLSILRTPYPTQSLQRKHRSSSNSGDGTDQRVQSLMFMMTIMIYIYIYIKHGKLVTNETPSSSSSSSVTSYVSIDLFPHRLIVSAKVFQVVFIHSVYNSALFLLSRCCSFFLHVVANLICIFLVSSWPGSTFSSSKIYSFLLWSKWVYSAVKCNSTIPKYLFLLLTDGNNVAVLCDRSHGTDSLVHCQYLPPILTC